MSDLGATPTPGMSYQSSLDDLQVGDLVKRADPDRHDRTGTVTFKLDNPEGTRYRVRFPNEGDDWYGREALVRKNG